MSQAPRELIRQVQICTRSAAGLFGYNPPDPTLPALPPFSIAADASDPSPPQIRCKNCKATLVRGSESIICMYCGLGPHYDDIPNPINFNSTIGYQWLLRVLRLDGSEMVDQTNNSEQNQGYNSPKALTPLSDFLHFKIPWPAEIEKHETTFSEKQSEQSRGSLRLTWVPPDKFFLKSRKNAIADMSIEQPFMHNQVGAADGKDVGYQNLFQNVQSSEPDDSSSKQKANLAFSEWEADFQSADFENQHEFLAASVVSESNIQDPKSFDLSTGLGDNLSAHIDFVFGFGEDLNGRKPEDNPAVSPGFDDLNSDDVWNNLSSNSTIISTKNDPEIVHTLVCSVGSSADSFHDFLSSTNYLDKTDYKTMNEEHKTADEDTFEEWNDFTGSTSLQFHSRNARTGGDYQVSTSDQKPSEMDLSSSNNKSEKGDCLVYSKGSSADLFQDFQSQTNYRDTTENKTMNEEHKTTDDESFEEWNDFTGSTSLQIPSQNAWTGDDYQVSTSEQTSLEMDLFCSDNKSEKGVLLVHSKENSDLFQDLQSRTNCTDKTENKPTNEEQETMGGVPFEEWNDFTFSTSLQFPSEYVWSKVDYQVSTSDAKSPEMDLFSFDNLSSITSHFSGGFDTTVSTKSVTEVDHTSVYSEDSSADLFQDFQSQTIYASKAENKTANEEHTTMDEDLFEEWNDFTGSTSFEFPSQNAWTGSDCQVSTSDQKSSEMDLLSF